MISNFLFHIAFTLCFSVQESTDINIFDAARKGDVSAISRMITIKADTVNSIDENGNSPLVLASYYGQHAAIKQLVKAGANVNYQSSQGTALCGVSYKGDTIAAQILLENGADVNSVDQNGTSPILYATLLSHNQLAKILLNFGADPTKPDNEGLTAKKCAITLENSELINLFEKF